MGRRADVTTAGHGLLFLLMLAVVFGVAAMHTLGHVTSHTLGSSHCLSPGMVSPPAGHVAERPHAAHGGDTAPAEAGEVSRAGAASPGHAVTGAAGSPAHSFAGAPGGGLPLSLDPSLICVAVLAAVALLSVAFFPLRGQGDSTWLTGGTRHAPTPSRGPPLWGRPLLTRLSVLRV
ncbi:hypothetical protein SAMN05421505_10551 [Sinosporangium album]|uniref:Uncharacterized protein n=1 Tax=Sinosporangium album TaxID=504805 RepID=A0A1G7UZQ0_9ACTN|nr:hypothetical protein SAMN05421505_10551 [Sinosporangium album]